MERGPFIHLGLALLCSVALAACAEVDQGGEGFGPCVVGQELSCPCPDGSLGVTTCTAQNTPGQCMCMSGAAGMMGGAGGLGGMASGGIGGVGGAAGMMIMPGGAGGMSGGIGGMSGGAGGMSGGAGGMSGGAGGMSGGMGGMTGGMGGMAGTGEDVPTDCEAAADWDPAWAEFEEEVLRLTNEARAEGHNCDSEGTFGPADPLMMSPILRCSSRLHSQDMGERDYFDHTAPDGRDPFERMADAGYMGFTMGENIAKGQQSPSEVVNGWLDSDGHCRNIMSPDFTEIGVGYWEGEPENSFFNGNKLWTQNFGAPRRR